MPPMPGQFGFSYERGRLCSELVSHVVALYWEGARSLYWEYARVFPSDGAIILHKALSCSILLITLCGDSS